MECRNQIERLTSALGIPGEFAYMEFYESGNLNYIIMQSMEDLTRGQAFEFLHDLIKKNMALACEILKVKTRILLQADFEK